MTKTVVLGVIGSDAHVVGITILEQAFSAAGFDVENLGVQTTQEEFVDAALTHEADAILVSSLYGHAEQDCQGFIDRVEAAGIDAVTYVGGNLAVGQDDFEQTCEIFRETLLCQRERLLEAFLRTVTSGKIVARRLLSIEIGSVNRCVSGAVKQFQ